MARGGINWTHDSLKPGIAGLEGKFQAFLFATFAYQAPRTESYGKSHAPWQDRTTNARNGLRAFTANNPPRHWRIVFAHGVNYGIWLEVKNNGEYAVILPTIRHQGHELMRMIDGAFGRLG